MRQGTRAFSRVSTGDSDIAVSWEMQLEPAFKSLQGNQPYVKSGHLCVHSIVAKKSGSPLHTYSLQQPPLDVLVESWYSS